MKILFLISIILLLFLFKKNIEPVILSCCGGIRLNRDFKATDPEPPKRVRRCMKEWNSPCTGKGEKNCCDGKDYCKPTKEGGKCKKKDGPGYYIYEDDTKAKVDYDPEKERIDINERKKKDKSEGKEAEAESEEENGEKDSMEILNYVLIGIIIIVILVLVGLFFFTGGVSPSTKTNTKTKSVLDNYGAANKFRADRNRVDNYNAHKSITHKYQKKW